VSSPSLLGQHVVVFPGQDAALRMVVRKRGLVDPVALRTLSRRGVDGFEDVRFLS